MAIQKSKEYQQISSYKEKVVAGQKAGRDKRYGPEINHVKICKSCKNPFTWFGRELTSKYKSARYCSVSCAHSRAEYWNENATRYQTIAFQNHDRKCVICDEVRILDVHHLDENRENNDPANLIPMCPTHHRYWHSGYKHLVEKQVIDYIETWKNNRV
jgi:uncharacterized protein YlaI